MNKSNPILNSDLRNVTPTRSRITDMGNPNSSNKKSNLVESRVVERRNSFYSYSGEQEAFLEKIVNDEYREAMDTMSGLRKYIN